MRAHRPLDHEPPRGTILAEGSRASVVAWGPGQVLKQFARDVERRTVAVEAAAARIAESLGVHGPRLLEEAETDSGPGLVFERFDNPTLLQQLWRRPWRIERVARDLAALHVRLQEHKPKGLLPLRERLRENIERGELPAALHDAALRRLDRLPDGDRLCHGDFHPGNVLMTPSGPAIIDWSEAATGHPDADAARTRHVLSRSHALLSFPPMPLWPGRWQGRAREVARARFADAYTAAYRELRPGADLDAWDVVVAAAKLGDRSRTERPFLLAFLTQLLHDTTR